MMSIIDGYVQDTSLYQDFFSFQYRAQIVSYKKLVYLEVKIIFEHGLLDLDTPGLAASKNWLIKSD